MRVVVDPALAAHDVCNRFRLVEERCPIFTDQQDFFVKQEVVYPADLSRCSIVGNLASATRALVRVDWNSDAVKHIDAVVQFGRRPSFWQVAVHFSTASFSRRSMISLRPSTTASSSVIASAARSCGSGRSPSSSSDSSLSQVMSSL